MSAGQHEGALPQGVPGIQHVLDSPSGQLSIPGSLKVTLP